jgi:hypothetical protein
MTQQNEKQTGNTPISDRGHSDPPGLWATVVLSSLVIHLFTFGILRLWLMIRINNFQVARDLIPVDVIAQASVATLPPQPTPSTASAATQNPSSVNTPTKTPNQVSNSQTSSTSDRANSSQTSTHSGVKKTGASATANQSPSAKGFPTVRKSPATNPSQNQSQETPTPKRSPAPNPSQNKPSGTQTPSTVSNSSTNKGNQANGSTPSPSPSPTPSTSSPQGQNSSNSKQGGGFIVALGGLEPISNAKDILHTNEGDKLATCPSDNKTLPSDDLKPLGISLDRVLDLKVEVLIDSAGKATLLRLPPQGLPENLSVDKAKQLAKKLVEQQQCNPTLMAGQAVYRDYKLTLTISPSQK